MTLRTCHKCIHCLVKGDPIVCGKLLGEIAADTDEGDEIDTELATGIAPDWAEKCEDYEPEPVNIF